MIRQPQRISHSIVYYQSQMSPKALILGEYEAETVFV